MLENEEVLDPDEIHNHHRLSTYFSFQLEPQATISFLSTTYVQPRLDLSLDYCILNKTKLSLSITSQLQFTVKFRLTYDSSPPIDIPSLTYDLVNGMKYKF